MMSIFRRNFSKNWEAQDNKVVFLMILYFWYLRSVHVVIKVKGIKVVGILEIFNFKIGRLGYIYKR